MDASVANTLKGRAPLRASHELRSALQRRGGAVGAVSYLYSSKNCRDIVVASDLAFWAAVDLEADEAVRAYDTDPERIARFLDGKGYAGKAPNMLVHQFDGGVRLLKVQRRSGQGVEGNAAQEAARKIGATWSLFTEADVAQRERLLHDWLQIIVVLGQVRWELDAVWDSLGRDIAQAIGKGSSLIELKRANLDSWELVFGAAFRLVQGRILTCDLRSKPLCPDTTLSPRAQAAADA